MPIKYDGVDINDAMDNGTAPQSTVHDGHLEGSFINDHEARMTYVMGATNNVEHYTLKNGILKIGAFVYQVPYTMNNGVVSFPLWEEKTNGNHTMTMEMKLE
ncbi:hypothetical protein [Lactiplantibacillus plantarum]|uniref:hypothetical protein n=1 Tax=Lactiplantibacillus plantarum TaxID=1590 RepID=UPI001BA82C55|nr:hypothetical protein [Lactiplantibacillus plantarum]